jgi:hypothetical protein
MMLKYTYSLQWWQMDKISPIKLYDENKTIAGFHLRQLMFKQNGYDYVRSIVDTLFGLYNDGKIKPQIDSVWAYENVRVLLYVQEYHVVLYYSQHNQ